MSVGKRIKEKREQLGLKQSELAEMLGVTKGAIGNYENGVSSPKEEILLKLFDVLDVEPNYLFQDSFKEIETPVTLDELDLIEKYRNLDDHGKRQVTTTLNNEYERCSVINSFDWGQFINREGALNFLNQRTQTMAFFGGDKDFDSMDDDELLKFAEVLSELK